jgi:hypothetical protein
MRSSTSLLLGVGIILGVVLSVFILILILAFYPDAKLFLPGSLYSYSKDVAGPIAAGFGGAIAGAICSYVLAERVEQEKDNKDKAKRINKSILLLCAKLAHLEAIKTALFTQGIYSEIRFLHMPSVPLGQAVQGYAYELIDDLLVENSRGLLDLQLAESNYLASLWNFEQRNALKNKVKEKIEDSVFGREPIHGFYHYHEVLGMSRLVDLYTISESAISVLDHAISSIADSLRIIQDKFSDGSYRFSHKVISNIKIHPNAYEKFPRPFYKDSDELVRDIEEALAMPHNPISIANTLWQTTVNNYRVSTIAYRFDI